MYEKLCGLFSLRQRHVAISRLGTDQSQLAVDRILWDGL
jgi:hypothetical protein